MPRSIRQWIDRKRRRKMNLLMEAEAYEALAPHVYRSVFGGTIDDARVLLREGRAMAAASLPPEARF